MSEARLLNYRETAVVHKESSYMCLPINNEQQSQLQRARVLKIRELDLSGKRQKHNYAGGSEIT